MRLDSICPAGQVSVRFLGGGKFETFGATLGHSPDPHSINPLPLFAKAFPALVAMPHYRQMMRVAAGLESLGEASITTFLGKGNCHSNGDTGPPPKPSFD
jgi:hypothetical protein